MYVKLWVLSIPITTKENSAISGDLKSVWGSFVKSILVAFTSLDRKFLSLYIILEVFYLMLKKRILCYKKNDTVRLKELNQMVMPPLINLIPVLGKQRQVPD